MLMVEFEKLYEPYSEDADLETTLLWFEREADARGIPADVRDSAVVEVFMEMARGKKFSVDNCSCSPECVFNKRVWSSADMNHYTLQKIIEKGNKEKKARAAVLLEGINTAMLAHIQEENAKYVAEANFSWLVNWNESEALWILEHLVTWRKSWLVRGFNKWL